MVTSVKLLQRRDYNSFGNLGDVSKTGNDQVNSCSGVSTNPSNSSVNIKFSYLCSVDHLNQLLQFNLFPPGPCLLFSSTWCRQNNTPLLLLITTTSSRAWPLSHFTSLSGVCRCLGVRASSCSKPSEFRLTPNLLLINSTGSCLFHPPRFLFRPHS